MHSDTNFSGLYLLDKMRLEKDKKQVEIVEKEKLKLEYFREMR